VDAELDRTAACNKLLLARAVPQSRAGSAGGQLDVRGVRSSAGCDIEQRSADRRMSLPEPTRLVYELTDALVARSRDTEPLGLRPDQAIDLRDRNRSLREALDEIEQARGES
jgi:hypothetical protein